MVDEPAIFQGGIFSSTIEGGRAGASIVATHKAVEAKSSEGDLFAIELKELQLELGGASGKMVFCRNADRSLTIFTEAPGFLESLEAVGGHHIREMAETLRQQSRQKNLSANLRWGALLALIVGLGTCTFASLDELAHTGAHSIPWSVDDYIGKQAIESMNLGGPKVEDEAIRAVPEAIVEKLAKHIPIEDLDLEIHVVDSPQVNAFALPGGQMVIFTGLMRKAREPEEIAGVLAHEIAHVTERHGLERIIQSMGVISLVQIFLGDATGVVGAAAQLLTIAAINDYSREQETEADTQGVLLLHDAGIDPRGVPKFFEVLRDQHQDPDDPDAKDSPEAVDDMLSWMSTHPETQDRIDQTMSQIATLPLTTYEPISADWEAMKRALDNQETP